MDYATYIRLSSTSVEFGIDSSISVREFEGHCVADNWISLPLAFASPRYVRNQFIEIQFNDRPNDRRLCYLYTCKDSPFQYSAASGLSVAAFLGDASEDDAREISAGVYRFKRDHVLIFYPIKARYEAALKDSSHIWGGIYHEGSICGSIGFRGTTGVILAFPNLMLPTPFHHTEALRANLDPSPIGRYLALYHLIELIFDYDLVEEIRSLPSDLRSVGKLLSEFDNKELARLVRLIKKYWREESSLAKALGELFAPSQFDDRLEELLFDYGKDGFPWQVKDDPDKRRAFLVSARMSFTERTFTKPPPQGKKLEWGVEVLQKAVAFCIYRFRCAIAHASIGECIISADDDDFVHAKAEPLIMAAINKIFAPR